jgi:hypothetical protein
MAGEALQAFINSTGTPSTELLPVVGGAEIRVPSLY